MAQRQEPQQAPNRNPSAPHAPEKPLHQQQPQQPGRSPSAPQKKK